MYILYLKALENDKIMKMTIKIQIMKKVNENLANLKFDLEYQKNMIESGNLLKYNMA